MNLPALKIGPYTLGSPFVLAPMAGVTDAPFRRICRHFGAGMISRQANSAFPVPEDNENSTVGTAGLGLRFISSNFNALTFSAGYDTFLFQADAW